MSEMKHTPGPWETELMADRDGDWYAIEAAIAGDQMVVADTSNRDYRIDPDQNRANARLIAAAPDLLAACRAVLADSDIGTSIELDGDPDEPVYDGDGAEWFTVGLVARLQAAVARATGA